MTIQPVPPANEHQPTKHRRDVGDTNVCWRCGLPILRHGDQWRANRLSGAPTGFLHTCPGAPFDLYQLGKNGKWIPQTPNSNSSASS